jgi:DNA modification methylase
VNVVVSDTDLTIICGEAAAVLETFHGESIDACVTSPPYLDARPEYDSPTLDEFAAIFAELRRVVTGPFVMNVGRLWREKRELLWWVDLLKVAEETGWALLDTMVWCKRNANPIKGGGFVTDAHEYCFVLGHPDLDIDITDIRTEYSPHTASRYGRKFDSAVSVKGGTRRSERKSSLNENGAKPKSYFETLTGKDKGIRHPCPMAPACAEHLVKFACPPGGTVVDPFAGSGTTGLAARDLGRKAVLIDLNADYCAEAADRLQQKSLLV